MAARSIASLTLSFGLVNIPVKLYSTAESGGAVKFNMLSKDGSRLKQQYVSVTDGKVVERADMVKGYEFEEDRFVLFTPEEIKAIDEAPNHAVEMIAFVPLKTVDPIYYDKAYFLAPDKRGAKPYALLLAAIRESGLCALARWAWKGKQYVVQVRAAEDGLVLQQLLYGEEVRSQKELNIEQADVTDAELKLALALIDQIRQDRYDPNAFVDEEKKRVLAAIDAKIAGKQVVATTPVEAGGSTGQVIDLMEALRASLGKRAGKAPAATPAAAPAVAASAAVPAEALKERKGARRATPKVEEVAAAAPAPRARARK